MKVFAGSTTPCPVHKLFVSRMLTRDLFAIANLLVTIKQEAQLMLTNPHDAFRGQWRTPNMLSFDMLGIVSY